MPLQPSRAQQCRVDDVGMVGGADDDDAGGAHCPVEEFERLVDDRVPVVVIGLALPSPADAVDLVDEEDRGGMGARFLEGELHPPHHVAKIGGFQPGGDGGGDQRQLQRVRQRARKTRLARSRRTGQEELCAERRPFDLLFLPELQILLQVERPAPRLAIAVQALDRRHEGIALDGLLRDRPDDLAARALDRPVAEGGG